MDGLVVDFASLRALAVGIDRRIENMTALLDDLDKKVAALTELWEGASAAGFRRTQAEWFAATEDLRVRLAGIRDLVITAHNNHAGAVRANTSMWRV
ncbi:MAG: WXG100 family type VII secretion target [Labedaea sp.]